MLIRVDFLEQNTALGGVVRAYQKEVCCRFDGGAVIAAVVLV